MATTAMASCGGNQNNTTGVSIVARPNPAGTVSAAASKVITMLTTTSTGYIARLKLGNE